MKTKLLKKIRQRFDFSWNEKSDCWNCVDNKEHRILSCENFPYFHTRWLLDEILQSAGMMCLRRKHMKKIEKIRTLKFKKLI